ncbi:hypothetical protein G3I60_05375 [Streptomyces sp. SID13666]|uniref:hypothetical protein n=1 Tax=Streptomyces sp. SID13666 TaxID=2706054 RepID=UPI0013C1D4CB|nr:hypothetical protein [Streptomyces sp. SID13666]NEA53602.1 hypothetical protein [Streptomyces sp. SID13666]
MAAGWRFIAQRAVGAEILDWDVPLTLSSNPRRDLSGPGSLSGAIDPEYARMIGSDGIPILQDWGTKLFAEVDGHIRWGGVVTDTGYEGSKYAIQCEGFTAYPHGIPYEDYMVSGPLITPKDPYAGRDKNHDGYIDFSKPKRKVPPAPKPYGGARFDTYDAVRTLWAHVQGKPYGNLGLVVDGHRLGKPLGAQDGSDPWELAWWDTPDVGDTIDRLARDTPFDYVEDHSWADGTSNTIVHRLRLGAPRLGRKRDDLRFAEGENITATAKPEGMGDDYANEAIVLGRGDGRAMKRAQLYRYDGRLRRVTVVADKTLASDAALRTRGEQELAGRTKALQIPAIEIRDHPNAALGSWALGDDIRLQVTVPWVGDVDVWHRIVADEISATGTCVLTLKRTDSFHY